MFRLQNAGKVQVDKNGSALSAAPEIIPVTRPPIPKYNPESTKDITASILLGQPAERFANIDASLNGSR